VATPTSTHAAVIEALLPAGIPIFTEKPLTADRDSAWSLAERAGDRLFVMDKWRYHPGVEMLRDIARGQELGPVRGLRTTRLGWGNPHLDVDGVWILAPHDLSIGLEVLGSLPPPRHAVAEHEGDLLHGLLAHLGDDPWLTLDVSVRSPQRRREVQLQCRDGVAVLADGLADCIQVTRTTDRRMTQDRQDERRPISTDMPLARELRAFVGHLQGGPPPRSTAAEGAAIVDCLSTLREMASPALVGA
jgi:predicted dehydrogenase